MSFKFLQKLPSIDELKHEVPISEQLKEAKRQRDGLIRDIFLRKSDKFLLIIGPCSADNEEAVCDYISRLAIVQEQVKDVLVLIPRVYTNKPRTTGEGYKGMAHQPNPQEEPNIVEGLKAIRRLHVRILRETGLSAADEMLYPGNYSLLDDVLAYVAIGARSVENQQHRLTVSGLDIPAGMKNPTSGDITVMINSVMASQLPHTFIYNGWEVRTTGNPLAHCIMRGGVDHNGTSIPNYHYKDLVQLREKYLARALANPTVIVDVSHANSNKIFKNQPKIALDVLKSMKKSADLKALIRGLMIESYIAEGSQGPTGTVYGKSITDACLGWEDSRELVLKLADEVSKI